MHLFYVVELEVEMATHSGSDFESDFGFSSVVQGMKFASTRSFLSFCSLSILSLSLIALCSHCRVIPPISEVVLVPPRSCALSMYH